MTLHRNGARLSLGVTGGEWRGGDWRGPKVQLSVTISNSAFPYYMYWKPKPKCHHFSSCTFPYTVLKTEWPTKHQHFFSCTFPYCTMLHQFSTFTFSYWKPTKSYHQKSKVKTTGDIRSNRIVTPDLNEGPHIGYYSPPSDVGDWPSEKERTLHWEACFWRCVQRVCPLVRHTFFSNVPIMDENGQKWLGKQSQ